MLAAIGIAGCMPNKQKNAELLLKDPVMQGEILDAIVRDSASLNELIARLDRHKMHRGRMEKMCNCQRHLDSTMMTDPSMKNRMLKHMLARAEKDSAFCSQMSDSIMRHKKLSQALQHERHRHGTRK